MKNNGTDYSKLDGALKFRMVAELKREMYADGCSDERAIEIMAEIRKIEAPAKKATVKRAPKQREQYMTVLGGYVLDMHDHGKMIGFRAEDGSIIRTR